MTGPERGFLLLCSPLGDPDRRVLTAAQLRMLGRAVQSAPRDPADRAITLQDIRTLGYAEDMAGRIFALLQEEARLDRYLQRAESCGCVCLTQLSPHYPQTLYDKLGTEGPGSIWCRGDGSVLHGRKISLVGSRELSEENQRFAAEAGRQAALQGYTLVSGNARGADRTAQEACLAAGGQVISVVADGLADKPLRDNLLYVSEEGFDLPFSAQRALSRNRIIHAMGDMTFVAQCGYQVGGTWSGTVKNLRFGYSPVYVYADESPAQQLLCDMGAKGIQITQLGDLAALDAPEDNFLSDDRINGGQQ